MFTVLTYMIQILCRYPCRRSWSQVLRPIAIYTFLFVSIVLISGVKQSVYAQNKYQAYFDEAYKAYPSVPRGLLEAVAYTQTRMQHHQHQESCQGLPQYYSIMGLVADGKGYFENSLQRVAEKSPYSEEQIIESPRIAILAYAAAYASEQKNKRMTSRSVDGHKPIIASLSEIPDDGSAHNRYAKDQQFYAVLCEMQKPHTGTPYKTRNIFDFESIFGKENYRVLKSPEVQVSKQGIRSVEGTEFTVPGVRTADCTSSKSKSDYKGAIWNPAHTNNYGSRNGEDVEFVTIHTIQGSYASAIAWFRNRNARVSAHYIIRALDGQVTQMVCEDDKAYHVKTDNATAIGLEHEGFIEDGAAWYTTEMYESSARLVKNISSRRNINTLQTFGGPPTNGTLVLGNKCWKIKGHQHFRGNNHIDPGPFWDWDRYYRLINDNPKPELFTSKKGDLYDSGKATGNYGDQQRKVYVIKPRNASSITLNFKNFDLEGTNEKPYDYLDIYDGESIDGKFLGRFTGNALPPVLIARSGAVYMEFRSDCQVNKKGWHLQYTSSQKNPECPTPKALVAKKVFPMGGTLSWESDRKADQYLVYLKRKLEKTWTLYKTTKNFISASGLSANALYQWQVVAVCEGDSSAVVGANFITPNVGRGAKPQIYTIYLNNGRFNDSGGALAGYGNKENYLYRIIPPNKGKVELTFSSFETEEDLDQLVVYDGLSPQSRVIGTYSGSAIPRKIRSSGNGLTLLFKSDNRTSGPGWLASWRSIGGSTQTDETEPPIVDNGNNTNTGNTNTPPTHNNGGDTDNGSDNSNTNDTQGPKEDPPKDPSPVIVDNTDFNPGLQYHKAAPNSKPELKASYTQSFNLDFEDKDRSGRGLANRFFTLAQEQQGVFRANPQSGFFNETFSGGLHDSWKQHSGTWEVKEGVLTQIDTKLGNTNLYTELRQTENDVYVYTWNSKMSGPGTNLRHGLHFFANKPRNPDRGNSYFVWIREGGANDYVEIYKTVNDQFDRKVRKQVKLDKDRVYNYKVIYNPKKGRIEVYLNNKFTASWVDRYPLSRGQYISLRSGNCIVSYDDLRVYKARKSSVKVSVDEGSRSMLKGEGKFKVFSLIVDRNIRWSKELSALAQLGTVQTPTPEPPKEEKPKPVETPTSPPVSDAGINYKLPFNEGNSFYLPVDNSLGNWRANEELGFLYEDFSGGKLAREWISVAGSWSQENNLLHQSQTSESNCNLYIPLKQDGNTSYVYHFKARFLTAGENKRFGLHFMASDGKLSNRGDSYLVWFRHYQSQGDKVEIYKADNNKMPAPRRSALLPRQFQPLEWYDIKIDYNPTRNLIQVYLENQEVLSWTMDRPGFRSGSAISLRIGNSQVQFDNLRVYQRAATSQITLSVGRDGMIRTDSRGKEGARIISINKRGGSGQVWSALKEEDLSVK